MQTFRANALNEFTNTTRTGTVTVAGGATEAKGGNWDGYEWVWSSPPGVTNVTVSGTGLSSGAAELYVDGSWARTNATLAQRASSYTAIAQDNSRAARDTNSISLNLPATNVCSYDLNGNLLSDGTRNFAFDDENQLVSVWLASTWSK